MRVDALTHTQAEPKAEGVTKASVGGGGKARAAGSPPATTARAAARIETLLLSGLTDVNRNDSLSLSLSHVPPPTCARDLQSVVLIMCVR